MLNRRVGSPNDQSGVILVMTLIVLVAMTLAAIALTRSTDTASLIAGNLAFQQSVTQSAELGLETAVQWIEQNNGAFLRISHADQGYSARGGNPASGQSWDEYWTESLPSDPVTLAKDLAGNTISYFIQRLCYGADAEDDTKKPTDASVGCELPTTNGNASGNSMSGGFIAPTASASQVYYRITVRIEGPRNTMSYVQAVVSR